MPNRILKESICTSDSIDQLSAFEETVFYRLIVNCDDYGRFDGRPKIIASKLFPLRDIRSTQIESALRTLTSAELVTLYEVGGKPFLQMNTWDRHQQKRATKSKYPSVDEADKPIDIHCHQLISDDNNCPRIRIRNRYTNSETNTSVCSDENAETQKRFTPPTLEMVTEYCKERNKGVDPVRWMNHYTANGWMVGKTKMKDWKAAVRTWEGNDNGRSGKDAGSAPTQDYSDLRNTGLYL